MSISVDDEVWGRLRDVEFPVAKNRAYFDHAAVAPLPRCAAETIRECTTDFEQVGLDNWPAWRKKLESTRRLAAEMIHAPDDGIALIRNTTEGISLIAEGIDWRDGDNVVIPDGEFPSNLHPWQNLASRGVTVRRVPVDRGKIDLQQLADACDKRTRVVSVSWIDFGTGYRRDLAKISTVCRDHNCLFFVDAIQGLGVFPIDVNNDGIDFLAADGHKWLLGPEGAGILYVRPELLETLRPIGIGWNSMRHAGDFSNETLDLKPTAARFEGGTYNMIGLAALGSSLEMWQRFKIPAADRARRVVALGNQICDQLNAANKPGLAVFSHRSETTSSGIISVEIAPG